MCLRVTFSSVAKPLSEMATVLRQLLPEPAVLVPRNAVCHTHSCEMTQTENNFPKRSCCPEQCKTPPQLAAHPLLFLLRTDWFLLRFILTSSSPLHACWCFLCFNYCKALLRLTLKSFLRFWDLIITSLLMATFSFHTIHLCDVFESKVNAINWAHLCLTTTTPRAAARTTSSIFTACEH